MVDSSVSSGYPCEVHTLLIVGTCSGLITGTFTFFPEWVPTMVQTESP